MAFRQREAARIFGIRNELFSPEACESLLSDKNHLGPGYDTENLHSSVREAALAFFNVRNIQWHGGASCDSSVVSSQIACLNCFFPFTNDALALKAWLTALYPDLKEILPITSTLEPTSENGRQPFLTFEWIGERSYLKERGWGKRGANCTNVDVMFRFLNSTGKVHVVLVEWKYCESYSGRKHYIHKSRRGTDRVAIYQPCYELAGCQITLGGVSFEDLFFEPLDQMMRLQLLASAMEREHEWVLKLYRFCMLRLGEMMNF